MLEESGDRLFEEFVENLKAFRRKAADFQRVCLAGKAQLAGEKEVVDLDLSKLSLYVKNGGMSGNELYEELLQHYHLQLEMAAGDYALALTSIGDSREGFDRLYQALADIDRRLSENDNVLKKMEKTEDKVDRETDEATDEATDETADEATDQETDGETDEVTDGKIDEAIDEETDWEVMPVCRAMEKKMKPVRLENASGRIAGEFVYLYPPGIPLIVPGEKISREFVGNVIQYREKGFTLQGMQDYSGHFIEVLEQV